MKFAFLYFLPALCLLVSYSSYGQLTANFSVDRYNICSGTSITLTNSSTNAHSYEWKLDGVFFSNQVDTVLVLIEPCYKLRQIRLVAVDTISGFRDSSSIVVEVFDSCFFHWTGDYLNCFGDTIRQAVNPEEIATEYVITPPQTLLSGCLNCPSISFVMNANDVRVDKTSTYFGGCKEITTYHYFCMNTNLEVLGTDSQFRLFPNPVKDVLSIQAEEIVNSIQIYNALGQLVFGKDKVAEKNIEINLSFLSSGIYFVHLELTSKERYVQRIVKS